MKRMNGWMRGALLLAVSAFAPAAMAAICTTNATGLWGAAGTWTCLPGPNHVPVAADTVVISRNITLSATTTIAGLTVNAGVVFSGNNKNLTVNGPVVIDGTYNTGGGDLTTTAGGSLTVNGAFNFNGGNTSINGDVAINGTLTSGGDAMQMTGANTTLSGTGNIVGTTIEIDATGVSVPAGANLRFDGNSEIDVAATVSPADLTVNGTIDGTAQAVGDRIIRVSTGGTLTVSPTGVIDAPNSRLDVRDGATAINNGTISIGELRGRTGAPVPVFTQGANSTLNINIAACGAANPCTFNASAAGNTVNYSGAAQTVLLPSGSTYANLTLSGSGAKTIPTGLTVTGDFTMSGSATVAAPAALTVGGDFIVGAGNTFTPGTGTVTLNGASAQTIGGANPVAFNNLVVTNAANPNVTLAGNVNVTGTLTGIVNLTSTCAQAVDYMLTSNGGLTVLHSCNQPLVSSIARASANPTVAASVSWTVTFNQNMTGVTTGNFGLVNSGLGAAPVITAISGSGNTWTVTASTGTGSGTLRLDMTNTTGVSPAPINSMPYVGQTYSVRPPVATRYYHDIPAPPVSVGFDGNTTAVSGAATTIPPIILSTLTAANTCTGNVRSANHPTGLYTHSRWYLNTNYAVATAIGANPAGSASLRGGSTADTVIVSLYDYDPTLGTGGGKTLIGSSQAFAISAAQATWTYTISSPAYIVPAGHRLMLEYNFNQASATSNARVYCSANSYIAVSETTAVPDHYELSLPTAGISCLPVAATVTVCADSSSPCTNPYPAATTATLASSAGTLGSTSPSFGVGGVFNTTLSHPAATDGAPATVTLSGEGAAAFNSRQCCPDGANCVVADSCTTVFSTAGLIFSSTDTASSGATAFSSQTAGADFGPYWLRAVKTNTTTKACEAAITTPHPVSFSYTCPSHSGCSSGNLLTIGTTASLGSGGASIDLTFNANGNASLGNFNFADVGKIKIDASATAGGATLVGTTSSFVVAPDSFAVTTTGTYVAGADFSVTAQALTATGAVAPNFGKETTPELVQLLPVSNAANCTTTTPIVNSCLVSPALGVVGTLTDGTFAGDGVANSGTVTSSTSQWNEVGTLAVGVTNANYLGSGIVAFGRSGTPVTFIPHHFDTAVVQTGAAPIGCPSGLVCPANVYGATAGMVYSGQPFSVKVAARNTAACSYADPDVCTTKNYQGTVTLSAWNTAGASGVANQNPGSGTLLPTTLSTFASGIATIATPTYTLGNVATAPTDVYLRADATGVSSLRAMGTVEGGVKVASGRIKISNAHGSELLRLPIAVTVQYWSAALGWLTSSTDSSSTFNATNVLFSNYQKNLTAINYPNAGTTSVTPASVVFASGVASYRLARPGAGNNGSVDMNINVPSYLQSNTARATFGVYKGNDEFIYLREAY